MIAYANGKLVWGQTLNHALGQIFGQSAPPTTPPVPGTADRTPPLTSTARTVLLQVQAHLKAAQAAYGRGDFATFAKEQAAAYRLIEATLGKR